MKLLIDLGNSRIKWALQSDTPDPSQSLTGHGCSADIGQALETMPSGGTSASQITGVWLASVANENRTAMVTDWVDKQGLSLHVAHTGLPGSGIEHGYARPQDLGVDRWLAMVAGRDRVRGAVAIVDAGSAITLDMVDRAGRHCGGLIMPGLRLLAESLRQGTALQWQANQHAARLATDTSSAISNGVWLSASGALRQAVELVASEYTIDEWLITGGDAAHLIGSCPPATRQIDDLVLQGLAIIAARQSGAD